MSSDAKTWIIPTAIGAALLLIGLAVGTFMIAPSIDHKGSNNKLDTNDAMSKYGGSIYTTDGSHVSVPVSSDIDYSKTSDYSNAKIQLNSYWQSTVANGMTSSYFNYEHKSYSYNCTYARDVRVTDNGATLHMEVDKEYCQVAEYYLIDGVGNPLDYEQCKQKVYDGVDVSRISPTYKTVSTWTTEITDMPLNSVTKIIVTVPMDEDS